MIDVFMFNNETLLVNVKCQSEDRKINWESKGNRNLVEKILLQRVIHTCVYAIDPLRKRKTLILNGNLSRLNEKVGTPLRDILTTSYVIQTQHV